MPSIFTILLLLTCAPHLLSSSTPTLRRILHQPYLPLNSLPPSQSPPPPPASPKHPSSDNPSSPFFPIYPSPPPSPAPPSPASFASFPANISSLILPQSPKPKHTSSKLISAAIASVLSAAVVVLVAGLLYYKRKRKRNLHALSDDKTAHRSDNSYTRVNGDNANGSVRRVPPKLRNASTPSSEFLYLGTIVNSRGIDERCVDACNSNSVGGGVRKMESPELRPLPPLVLGRRDCDGDKGLRRGEDEEDEDEEFYSPRGSLGGRESESGTGSGSRRVLDGAKVENHVGRGSDSSSLSSSGSPARNCLSSSFTLSPRRSELKDSEDLSKGRSPTLSLIYSETEMGVGKDSDEGSVRSSCFNPSERVDVSNGGGCRSMHSSIASSPERGCEKNSEGSESGSIVSDRIQQSQGQDGLQSSSPILGSETSMDASLRMWNNLDGNGKSSSQQSMPDSSPDRVAEKSPNESIRMWNSNTSSPDRVVENSADESLRMWNGNSSSPVRVMEKSTDESLRMYKDSNLESPPYSSPDITLEVNQGALPRVSNVSDHGEGSYTVSTSLSSSPDRVFDINLNPSPRGSSGLDQNRQSHSPSSSLCTSPEMFLDGKWKEGSPKLKTVVDQKEHFDSQSSSPSLESSPERIFGGNFKASSRMYVLDQNKESTSQSSSPASSPERGLNEISNTSSKVQDAESCVTNHNSAEQSSSVAHHPSPPQPPSVAHHPSPPPTASHPSTPAPPIPPPPPPLPSWRRNGTPSPRTPTSTTMTRPPPLIPPSRPFVMQNPANVSPFVLPTNSDEVDNVDETPKPKLKPLHWDKVRATSDREMVWDHLRSNSFKLNEERFETLFVVNNPVSKPNETTQRTVLPSPVQENRVLDPKKSQNIAILLRALNVTIEEVCDALLEGNADTLGTELLESLLKMAPTKEEERKLKEYKDDSPVKLGTAEKFLKAVLDVPFAFKRVDAMLYIANFESEVEYLKKSFETLEAACEELRNSRMFLKLLEAVLKTGNRMNVGTARGDAHAFKLDTLLKLADVKGADGKTTLLHFVVQEVIRSEGARILDNTTQTSNSSLSEDAKCRRLGLQVVSSLGSELNNVKKAAAMDSDVISSDVSKLSKGVGNIREVLQIIEKLESNESKQKFSESMNNFMKMAEEEIIRIQAQESVALSLVKEITEYFHGNSAKEEAHPFRIFMVVRDFLTVLDRVCKEVGMINERTIVSSAHKFPVPVNPTLPQAFAGPHIKRQCSSSDDESSS